MSVPEFLEFLASTLWTQLFLPVLAAVGILLYSKRKVLVEYFDQKTLEHEQMALEELKKKFLSIGALYNKIRWRGNAMYTISLRRPQNLSDENHQEFIKDVSKQIVGLMAEIYDLDVEIDAELTLRYGRGILHEPEYRTYGYSIRELQLFVVTFPQASINSEALGVWNDKFNFYFDKLESAIDKLIKNCLNKKIRPTDSVLDYSERPKVGVGVMVLKDGKVLLGKRNKASHADQLWCMPGGHLEYGETFEVCAKREVMEEAGIEIENLKFLATWNQLSFMPKHFVGIGLLADWKSGEPRPEEGDKMIDWTWFDLENLPEPIFPPSKMLVEAYKTGVNFVDGC